MTPTLAYITLAFVGVDLGYQPASNGGAEFIIQIRPATLQALQPGSPIELDVPREAQDLRPSHFRISLGDESLPHVVPVAASRQPATAPYVQANPVMAATATGPLPMTDGRPTREPGNMPPPSSGQASPRDQRGLPPIQENPGSPSPTANSAGAPFGGLPPLSPNANATAPPDHPWLLMCLLVIALMASNGYVGWLFWEARQRYLGLVARTFAFGPTAAEA